MFGEGETIKKTLRAQWARCFRHGIRGAAIASNPAGLPKWRRPTAARRRFPPTTPSAGSRSAASPS